MQGSAGYEIGTATNRAAERLRGALQPVAAATGLAITPAKVSKFAIGLWIYLGLALIFLVVLIGLFAGGVLE